MGRWRNCVQEKRLARDEEMAALSDKTYLKQILFNKSCRGARNTTTTANLIKMIIFTLV